ncbi:hypothetical protein DPMN_048556 [Dreissena polymorpha]|uniref:Uncharacterized protein n=1 Tax=Dreissena polymorpha TaxID=45954 RepID=A0A9D4DAW7_DREPO|nr:hypothetical protein DPMN_048556 [Dreissena polymorpha]
MTAKVTVSSSEYAIVTTFKENFGECRNERTRKNNGGDCEIVLRTHERTRKDSLGYCEVVVISHEMTRKESLGDCKVIVETQEMTLRDNREDH